MYSDRDTPKGWVSPFGHPRINDRSHLPAAFRSVPRPSSPLGAKASTECPFLTLYPHHRPRTGPNHAPCNYLPFSGGSARNIPRARSNLAPGRCASLTHTTTDHLHHVKEHAVPQATRFPLEDRGPPARNETGFGSAAAPRAAHQASNRHRHAIQAQQISLIPSGTKGNGDGRIRTDDPLLAKQVLSH